MVSMLGTVTIREDIGALAEKVFKDFAARALGDQPPEILIGIGRSAAPTAKLLVGNHI